MNDKVVSFPGAVQAPRDVEPQEFDLHNHLSARAVADRIEAAALEYVTIVGATSTVAELLALAETIEENYEQR